MTFSQMSDELELVEVEREKAVAVLAEIDGIIANAETFANRSVARISKLLVEAKHGAYWVERGYKSEDDYVKTLPYSRAQYYNLVSIGLHLGFLPEETIADLGIKKSEALVRISKHSPALTDEWIEKAKKSTHAEFLGEVRAFFKNKDDAVAEEIEWIRVKASKSQGDVIREAFSVAEKMLGSDKSQAHQLEIIAADFLSGYNDDGSGRLENRDGFLISVIGNLSRQLSHEALGALLGTLSVVIERSNNE